MSILTQRKVLVLGCGALGGALIASLNACADVSIIDPYPCVRVKNNIFQRVDDLNSGSFDGIIVATKCYDVDKALMPLKGRFPIRRILFLQNGVLNLTKIQKTFADAGIVRGVTTSAVGFSSRRAVFHYQGDFFLAPDGDKDNGAAAWFGELLCNAGLKVRLFSKSSRVVWAKLIFSAVMNPLPIITGGGYDVLKKDPAIWKLVRQAVEEGRTVAQVLGIRLAFDPLNFIRRVRAGDLAGISHRGSIYQDISAGRPTELNFITGAVIREARRLNIKAPALESIFTKARAAGA